MDVATLPLEKRVRVPMSLLANNYVQRALAMCIEYHNMQERDDGELYVWHPIRVALSFDSEDWEARCVALLHDLVEDTSMTIEVIEANFPMSVSTAVDLITHEGQTEEKYMKRVLSDRLASMVKLADMKDNLRFEGLFGVSRNKAGALARKYTKRMRAIVREWGKEIR
jgi:(p)ppGpp synthase/HD superfamily hydrolase